MSKAEQARQVAWRLRILQQSGILAGLDEQLELAGRMQGLLPRSRTQAEQSQHQVAHAVQHKDCGAEQPAEQAERPHYPECGAFAALQREAIAEHEAADLSAFDWDVITRQTLDFYGARLSETSVETIPTERTSPARSAREQPSALLRSGRGL